MIAAPLEPLYQVSPGRGRTPAVEAVVMIEPPPRFSISGTHASVDEIDRLHVDRVDAVELVLGDVQQRLVPVRARRHC